MEDKYLEIKPHNPLSYTCISNAYFVGKSGIVESHLSWANFKQSKEMKKTDGTKRQKITGIMKLNDANDAVGKNSDKCTLILTEGDSVKALAMVGIAVVGRNHYEVFPHRGKMLNVREASHKKIMENAESQNIKQILGLQHGKECDSVKGLRYGHLMIMSDQVCHTQWVIHRDLKPENLLFANKKETAALKAIDFGLSVFFKPGQSFNEIVRSPYYMAPEVLKRNYGPEIDVWSAGVILCTSSFAACRHSGQVNFIQDVFDMRHSGYIVQYVFIFEFLHV